MQRGGVGLASASDTVRAEQHRCRRRCRVSRRDLCGVAQRQFALVPLLKLRDGALEGREELVALQVEPCDLVLVLVAETSAMFRNSCVRVCSTKPLSSERITDNPFISLWRHTILVYKLSSLSAEAPVGKKYVFSLFL